MEFEQNIFPKYQLIIVNVPGAAVYAKCCVSDGPDR